MVVNVVVMYVVVVVVGYLGRDVCHCGGAECGGDHDHDDYFVVVVNVVVVILVVNTVGVSLTMTASHIRGIPLS